MSVCCIFVIMLNLANLILEISQLVTGKLESPQLTVARHTGPVLPRVMLGRR